MTTGRFGEAQRAAAPSPATTNGQWTSTMSDAANSGGIGQTFGNYRIVAELGTGGMGHVYRAQHLHLDREVAIKLLHPHLAADAGFRARFQREARSVSLLDHPNIVRLYDYGEQGQTLYLIMELLTDGSLRTMLRARETAVADSLGTALDLVRQAADALAYAHDRGMVHRDIKPDNLLLKLETHTGGLQQTTLKVADFGLAHLAEEATLTASGMTMGTPAYMSPEQCQGLHVDARSDIYALGVVLYELVAGRVPFATRSLSDAIYNHVYVAPPPPRSLRPDLPEEVEAIILRCLAKRPEDRYATMHDLAADLRSAGDRFALADVPLSLLGGAQPEASEGEPTPTGTTPSAPPVSAPPMTPTGGVQIPRLYVLGPDNAVQQVVDLTGNGLTLGRLDDNDVVLNEPGVSRHHLLIDWNGSEATVTDLGSSNGTLLGGVRLPPQVPRIWNVTDELRIGPLQLRLARPVSRAALEADTAPDRPVTSLGAAASVPVAAGAGLAAATASTPEPAVASSASAAALPAASLAPPSLGGSGVPPAAAQPADRGSATRLIVISLVIALLAAGAFLLTRGGNDDGGTATGATNATATVATGTPAAPTTGVAGASTPGAPETTATSAGSGTAPATPAATSAATASATTGVAGTQAAANPAPAATTATGPVPTPVTTTVSTSDREVTAISFDGAIGQRVMVEMSDMLIGPASGYGGQVVLLADNGVQLARASLWTTESRALIDATTLPAPGTYHVAVQLEEGVTLNANLTLHTVPPDQVLTGSPGDDAVTLETTAPGQMARLTFQTSGPQRIFVEVTNGVYGPTSGYAGTLTVQASNGSVLSSRSLWITEPQTYIDTVQLPLAGTYTLVLDPDAMVVGSMTLRLLDVPSDISETATVGGDPLALSISAPGQNATVTFSGNANQQVTIEVSEVLIGPTSGYGGSVILTGPGGAEVTRRSLWATESTLVLDNVVLPATGTYTILIDPDGANAFSGTIVVRAGS
jgi:serine/threonine protein kinase